MTSKKKRKNPAGFRRPRPASDLTGSRPLLSRLKKEGKLQQASLNYYYVVGWFEKLEDWTMRDAMLHLVISLNSLRNHESLGLDDDPRTLRLLAKTLRGPRVVGLIQDIADALDARADNIEIEDTTTEAIN